MRSSTLVLVGVCTLALILGGCYPNGPGSPYISTEPSPPTRAPIPLPVAATQAAELRLTPAPAPAEYTVVILGLDKTVARCERGERCNEFDPPHSDIFVVVHVVMSDLPKATAVLVPRSLYVPNIGYEMWSMQVYGKLGFEGVHGYVESVFGLPVDAVLAIDMDQFVGLIDKLEGLKVGDQVFSGVDLLSYLRDNDNNWGCAEYDCEGRIFAVARALRARVPDLVFWTLGSTGLYETDLSFSQFLTYLRAYYDFEDLGGTVEFVRLWRPDPLESNDTPLDIRGLVPVRPVHEWMAEVLESR